MLIEGVPGSGKSTMALALIDRGAQLVGDDGVMLAAHQNRLIAKPHPRTQGLLEIRNLGILPFEFCARVSIALVVVLDEHAPRFIEGAPLVERGGVQLPSITIWPGSSALKVEHGLRIFGISE